MENFAEQTNIDILPHSHYMTSIAQVFLGEIHTLAHMSEAEQS
jgi:hypothetical protein